MGRTVWLHVRFREENSFQYKGSFQSNKGKKSLTIASTWKKAVTFVPHYAAFFQLCGSLSAFTFAYTAYTGEFGIVWGKEDHKLQVLDRLRITNGIGALNVYSDLLVRNDGTRKFRVHKTRAMVWLGSTSKELQSKSLLEIEPKSSWRGKMRYFINLSDGEWRDTTRLDTNIKMYLLREFHNKKKIEEAVFLPPELMEEIKKTLNRNIAWIKEHDEYYIMFGYWINNDDREPSVVELYKFKVDQHQIKILSSLQLESLKAPNEGIIKENKTVSWSALSRVTHITDHREIISRLADFRRAFVE